MSRFRPFPAFLFDAARTSKPEAGRIDELARQRKLSGRVVAIGGTNRGTYERRGYLEALDTQIMQGIFGYCGMPVLGLGLLLPLDKASADEGLLRAFELGRSTAQGAE